MQGKVPTDNIFTVVPMASPNGKVPLIDRFMADVDTSDDCWEWTGPQHSEGYGRFYVAGKPIPAHRFAFELWRGQVGKGYHVHHSCHNRVCVNPAHLVALTSAQHMKLHHPQQTHCPRGHAYHHRSPNGSPRCQTCDRERQRRNRADPEKRERVRQQTDERLRRQAYQRASVLTGREVNGGAAQAGGGRG